MSDFHLTVLQEFRLPPPDNRHFRKGDHIDDAATVDLVLGGELIHHVIKVSALHDDVTSHARAEATKASEEIARHLLDDHA